MAYLDHNQPPFFTRVSSIERTIAVLDHRTSWEQLIESSLAAGETIYVDGDKRRKQVLKIADRLGIKAYVRLVMPDMKDKAIRPGRKKDQKRAATFNELVDSVTGERMDVGGIRDDN